METHESNECKDQLTHEIIGCVYEVYNTLGPGLLESIYQKALAIELTMKGFNVQCEVAFNATYKGYNLVQNLRLDMLVDDKVIIELKSVDHLNDLHKKQLLTYLKMTGKKVGLLINFNESYLRNGLIRIVNSGHNL